MYLTFGCKVKNRPILQKNCKFLSYKTISKIHLSVQLQVEGGASFMTQEEKYVMSRTAACLAICAFNDYQSSLLIDWVCDNERYKKLNADMSTLIAESRQGKDVTEQIQEIYNERMETSANMLNIQAALQIPEEFLGKKSKTEEYVFSQMHIKLAIIAPEEKEPEILLAWAAANFRLKNINKQLGVLYAKGKKNGFQSVAEEYNQARGLKEQYIEEKNAAVSQLEGLAKEQGRRLEGFPLKKKKIR